MTQRVTTAAPAESNYAPVEYLRRMQKCADAVCRVVNSTGTLGTGFLIGRQLIITNNHILPTEESCTYIPATESTPARGVAQFFYEDEKPTIAVPLDGRSVFLTSQSPGRESAKGEFLDFTIVALATVPENDDLARIYLLPLSLFKDVVTPSKNDEAFIVQHPKGEKTKISWGPTRVITQDNDAVHYNTRTDKGSSGSPVLNKQRLLFAIHRLGKCPVPAHGSCNQGVLIKSVVAFLKKMKNPKNLEKNGFEAIQDWLDEKEQPLEEIAQLQWKEAKSYIQQTQKYFEKDRKEPFSRKKAYKYLTQAYNCLTEALKQYKTPQAANQKADKQKIEQQRDFVRWQKMVVALELAIPVFLPHLKDQNHPMLSLLRNAEEPILTLDKWLTWQQDQIQENPNLESDPAVCFMIAFVAEEFFNNEQVIVNDKSQKIKLSAKWYVSLAKSYHDRGDNIFLKRACLEKARALDPSIESERKYDALDKTFRIRENRFELAFTEALKKLDSPSSSKPSCFIFHDREQETEEWIDRVFYPHLKTVGSQPLYDKYDKKIKTAMAMVHFICEGIKDSKYVLLLCTPSLVEKEVQASAIQGSKKSDALSDIDIIGYAFEMLYQLSMGAANSNILRLIQDGDSQESIPRTFAKRESFLCNTTHKYYENILRVFDIIKSPDDGGGELASPVGVPLTTYGTGGDGGGGILVEELISRLNMIDLGAERMEALAANGDPEANFHLAQSYSFGHGYGTASYDVNLDKAIDLYKKALSLEDGRAEVRLGQILTYQKRAPQEVLEWFVKAEQKGNLQALIELEKFYRNGTEIQDLAKAELLRGRIANKIAEIKGRSRTAVETKEKIIFEHNRTLANSEDLMGMMGLAWCYNNGCGVAKNPKQAADWQRIIDRRLQAEQARAQASAVEGQVLRTDPSNVPDNLPKAASSVAVEPAQASAVESLFLRTDPSSLGDNLPKPAASAKEPVTAQPLVAEDRFSGTDPSSLAENLSKPAALAKEPVTAQQARAQPSVEDEDLLEEDLLSYLNPSSQDAKSFELFWPESAIAKQASTQRTAIEDLLLSRPKAPGRADFLADIEKGGRSAALFPKQKASAVKPAAASITLKNKAKSEKQAKKSSEEKKRANLNG